MKGKRFFSKQLILFISALSLFFLPTSSLGATFCVSNATELQSALTIAENIGEDNTIQIVQGTYSGNFIYASTEAYGLTMAGGYTQDCASRTIDPANTILDGGGVDMVLALVSQGAATFSVEGLTLQNGNASTTSQGGGLYAKTQGKGNVTLTDNTFTNNTADGTGGGVYVLGTATLTDNTFSGNISTNGNGGGVSFNGSATLSNNTFTNNTAGGSGGGVSGDGTLTNNNNTFIENTATYSGGGVSIYGVATLSNNTFTRNTANRSGGGVSVGRSKYASNSTLTNNTFSGNISTNGNGGGASFGDYVSDIGTATLSNNTFTDNTASSSGGGVYGKGTLTNNIFTGNTATNGNGGGIYGGGTLTNNTFSGNTAATEGGGVYVYYGNATLTNNIFTGNTAANGGGIYNGGIYGGGTLTNNTFSGNIAATEGGGAWLKFSAGNLYNNIIWSNSAPEGADLYIDNTDYDPFFPEINLFNNDFDQSASGTYMTIPLTIDPSNLDNEDPLFVGGGNYHLTASSPCINTGDNDAPDLPSTDKDGNPRIMGGIVDMGAYEFVATVYAAPDGACGGNTPCFSTIQAAIDAADTESIIRILQGTFDEDVIIDQTYVLTFSGGWDSTFTTQSSNTVINSLTITGTSGTVEIENVVLQ
jgi:predicted outer membrane repeat protein